MLGNSSIMGYAMVMVLFMTLGSVCCTSTASDMPESPNYSSDSVHLVGMCWRIAPTGAQGMLHDTVRGVRLQEVWLDTIIYSPDRKYSFGIVGMRIAIEKRTSQPSSRTMFASRYIVVNYNNGEPLHTYPVSNEETFFADTSRADVDRKARAWLFEHYDIDGSTSKPSLWDDPRISKRSKSNGAKSGDIKEYARLGKYAVGQVWRYRHSEVEDSSRLTIVKILRSEVLGDLYVIYITGLRLENPGKESGTQNLLPHVVVSQQSLDASVTQIADSNVALEGFFKDYNKWKGFIERGAGPIFTEPVSESLYQISFLLLNGQNEALKRKK